MFQPNFQPCFSQATQKDSRPKLSAFLSNFRFLSQMFRNFSFPVLGGGEREEESEAKRGGLLIWKLRKRGGGVSEGGEAGWGAPGSGGCLRGG